MAVVTISRQVGSLATEVARPVSVQVLDGAVILRGSVPSSRDVENCKKTVEGIEGVRQVDNQLLTSEFYRYGA